MNKVFKLLISFLLISIMFFTSFLTGVGSVPASAKKKSKKDSIEKIEKAKDDAVAALTNRLAEERECVYVYKDFDLTENHYTQKALIAQPGTEKLVFDMDENWQKNPYSGKSCIRCEQVTREGAWGGWLFLNGELDKGETVPKLNDGTRNDVGLDLTGADALRFYAKGEKGGEVVEFFTAGFGFDGQSGDQIAKYPDSTRKQTLGEVTLTKNWEEYIIPLTDADLSYIVCGFGFVLDYYMDGYNDNIFYLDDIRFTGNIKSAQNAPVLLRSYDTDNVYIHNAAYTYDNALVAMAFISEGKDEEAKQILDAFVYAIDNDRDLLLMKNADKRARNAYAAGDISPFPGWNSGTRLPGWYDNETREFYEDRYTTGLNCGNASWYAISLLQGFNKYNNKKYLKAAQSVMDWVLNNCTDGNDGFTAGFDGWREGNPPVVYNFTYRSIEHNIDCASSFSLLYKFTGKKKYKKAAQSAKRFVLSMYDEENECFCTGTLEDGVTPTKEVTVLDAQVWCRLAIGKKAFKPYKNALKTVETMKTKEGAYPFCLENKNGGFWCEGSAYTALMYKLLGENDEYLETMNALVNVQLKSGLFPAATVDNLSTGMYLFTGEPWEYSTDPHIAGTAWFIMVVNGFNPYVIN